MTTAQWKNNCTTRIAELPAGNGNIEADPLFVDGVAPMIRPVSPFAFGEPGVFALP